MTITRRGVLGGAGVAAGLLPLSPAGAQTVSVSSTTIDWSPLEALLGDRLLAPVWPLRSCLADPPAADCAAFFEAAKNPYFLGDDPTLTQTLGWVDAWTSRPGLRVLAAGSAADVAAAIRFARERGIRIAVKGGGHSYTGGSNGDGALLLWTRRMNAIAIHDAFVPQGSSAGPIQAVSVGAGALWGEVYRQVCAGAGRYVQGGGCLTVGVAGLVQSGGFGSLSKTFGTAAASLLEAEIVTADGEIRVVNAVRDPDLFFALRGGGGGSFGLVTRVTMRTHDMPATIGAVFAEISARSDEAYRALIERMLGFYADALHNPAWGEQIGFRPDNRLRISMRFQGLTQAQAESVWAPFWAWLRARPHNYRFDDPTVIALQGQQFFDPAFLKTLPGIVLADDRPGADRDRIYWAGNREESGQFLHGFASTWVPAASLRSGVRGTLADGLFDASRHWGVNLHTNKGLSGAPEAVREDVRRDTATNPVVTESFALAICGAEGPPAYPGVRGFEPDAGLARRQAGRISAAMAALSARVPVRGSYLSESDFFEPEWQLAFWGAHYPRLQRAKAAYDPGNLFRVHHGVEA